MRTLLEVLIASALVTVGLVAAGSWLMLRWARRTVRSLVRRLPVALPVGREPARGLTDRLVASRVTVRAVVVRDELSRVRSALRTEVTATVRGVVAAERAGRPVGQLPALARRVREHARAVDVDLALVAAEPDRQVRMQLLQGQATRLAELRHACAQLRAGTAASGGAVSSPMTDLAADLEHEVTGRRLFAQAHTELTRS